MEKNQKGLSVWQLTMMTLGTVVGGSFFLGSSVSIRSAGPAVIISYILGGILVYFVLSALLELTLSDTDPGSFRTFARKAFGSGAGFIVGWVYWTGIVLAMSSEAMAASILFTKWFPGFPVALVGSIIIIGVTLLNLLGAEKLSRIESGLASIKLLSIVSFIILAILIIIGLMPGIPRIGMGSLTSQPLLPGGIRGIAGSMLIVTFAYAGFEIIGLAASEAKDPKKTVPKAIRYTVITLVGLYITSVSLLIFLIPTNEVIEDVSPMVAALNRWGFTWAGTAINIVLITAILSTMLASMFGLAKMIRSLTDEGQAPKWLKDKRDVPYRCILFSGFAILSGLGLGFILPSNVYIFLTSFGGFSLLFTYGVIVATHIKFRKEKGDSTPFTSWIALISIVIIIASMPLVSGQGLGLIAGLTILSLYSIIYLGMKLYKNYKRTERFERTSFKLNPKLDTEFSKELYKHKEDKK
ncbi:hypothetical protein Curi_c26440 [Gottschalkia acidurici 9a]|uniref:Amino acid permease/ SLC12A domain-containing protein n=1 Tax=Gottschalkia acidurici (strain ATCC 7906 / DSM 604 / BCRC 14475 / CIP 104303 / KCTC 5404 / NCIMB 10678 / 9a) TaxID=1128398 RepID=K0B2B9_GOTA9|nr:amino acid permease [Gottschalkia acidurici]AFS79639.1 hypothetical protein Curi_c26440 [Gottschalkia acidurici 9a]